jgi:hypothetical protein
LDIGMRFFFDGFVYGDSPAGYFDKRVLMAWFRFHM